MSSKLTEKEMDRRIEKFRKIVKYRKVAGVVLAVAGAGILFFSLKSGGDPLLMANGGFCLCYGAFMRMQAVRAEKKM